MDKIWKIFPWLVVASAFLVVLAMAGCTSQVYLRSQRTMALAGPYAMRDGTVLYTCHEAYEVVRSPTPLELSMIARMRSIRFGRLIYHDATIQDVVGDLMARQRAQGLAEPVPIRIHLDEWYHRKVYDSSFGGMGTELDADAVPPLLSFELGGGGPYEELLGFGRSDLYAVLTLLSEMTDLPIHILPDGVYLSQRKTETIPAQGPEHEADWEPAKLSMPRAHFATNALPLLQAAAVDRAAELLKLVPPVDIVQSDYYRDGGSCAAILLDSEGTLLPFCVDNRINTSTKGMITIGTYHPGNAGGGRHPPGSKVAKALVTLFEEWLSQTVFDELWTNRHASDDFPPYRLEDRSRLRGWSDALLEQRKWPYSREPKDHIEWTLNTYDLLRCDQ